jgi:hypothetical protein
MNTDSHHPLRDGNRLQRAYYRWASPHYQRLAPDLREQAEQIDQFLYTRQGLSAWIGWLFGLLGMVVGLRAGVQLPWGAAFGLGALLWVVFTTAGLAIWLKPLAFLGLPTAQRVHHWLVAGMWGCGTFAFVYWARHGNFNNITGRLSEKLLLVAPGLLITALALALVF